MSNNGENRFRPVGKPIGPRTFIDPNPEATRAAVFRRGINDDDDDVFCHHRRAREGCDRCDLEDRIKPLRDALGTYVTGYACDDESHREVAVAALRADDKAAK